MADPPAGSIDLQRLEAILAERNAKLRRAPLRRYAWIFLRTVVFFWLLFTTVLPWLEGQPVVPLTFTGRNAAIRLILALALGFYALAVHVDLTRKAMRSADASDEIRRIYRDHERMTGPHWVLWTLRTGVLMGLAVGIPIGLLLAIGLKPGDLPPGGRVATVPLFTAVSLVWTIPFAFGIRWIVLRSHRRFASGPSRSTS